MFFQEDQYIYIYIYNGICMGRIWAQLPYRQQLVDKLITYSKSNLEFEFLDGRYLGFNWRVSYCTIYQPVDQSVIIAPYTTNIKKKIVWSPSDAQVVRHVLRPANAAICVNCIATWHVRWSLVFIGHIWIGGFGGGREGEWNCRHYRQIR